MNGVTGNPLRIELQCICKAVFTMYLVAVQAQLSALVDSVSLCTP